VTCQSLYQVSEHREADLEATLRAGLVYGTLDGLIINSSRGIIYASSGEDFPDAARAETQKLNNEINAIRQVMRLAA
jgi:orotidine-5'-phosphate decarboxylase